MSVLLSSRPTQVSIHRFSSSISRNKAVSDGAISFYLDHFVRTRVSKITYGNFCHIPYDSTAPDHKLRAHKVFTSVSGHKRISDSFDIILPKVSCAPCLTAYPFKNLFLCRIPKFRRQENSKSLISENQRR